MQNLPALTTVVVNYSNEVVHVVCSTGVLACFVAGNAEVSVTYRQL